MAERTWARAVAAVVDGSGAVRGTAFFIGSDVALTCRHVMTAAIKQPIRLKPSYSSVSEQIIEEDYDEELDVSLLRVPTRPGRAWLELDPTPVMENTPVTSHGYPRDRDLLKFPDGYPLEPSRVSGKTTLVWRGQSLNLLVLSGAEVSKGMSGAPALDVDRQVAFGILRLSERAKEAAYAIPAASLMRRWPKMRDRPGSEGWSFSDLTPTLPTALAKT